MVLLPKLVKIHHFWQVLGISRIKFTFPSSTSVDTSILYHYLPHKILNILVYHTTHYHAPRGANELIDCSQLCLLCWWPDLIKSLSCYHSHLDFCRKFVFHGELSWASFETKSNVLSLRSRMRQKSKDWHFYG